MKPPSVKALRQEHFPRHPCEEGDERGSEHGKGSNAPPPPPRPAPAHGKKWRGTKYRIWILVFVSQLLKENTCLCVKAEVRL